MTLEEMKEKTLKEIELVNTLKKVGVKGYYIDIVDEGLLYRFVDMKGKWYEFLNISKNGIKKLKLY